MDDRRRDVIVARGVIPGLIVSDTCVLDKTSFSCFVCQLTNVQRLLIVLQRDMLHETCPEVKFPIGLLKEE